MFLIDEYEKITSFRDEYSFLSNFHPCEIVFEGMTFPTLEHAYVAAKTFDKKQREIIRGIKMPGQAKRYGRDKITLRSDWEDVKVSIMRDLVYQKFTKHEILKQKLLNTGDKLLVEGNQHGDTFWGTVNGKGKNQLGVVLMNVRDKLKND